MLSRYVFLTDPANSRLNLILCTEPPYVAAQVWSFREQQEFDDFISRRTCVTVQGYRIALTEYCRFGATDEPADLNKIATFYLENRVSNNKPRFKAYLDERDKK